MPKIFVAGDFGYRGRVKHYIENGQGLVLFEDVVPYIKDADFSVINLESPVGDSTHFIEKCGPALCCSKDAIKTIKEAGFDLVTLANNHFFDCGQFGVEKTIDACKENHIHYVGGGIDYDMAYMPFHTIIKDKAITIINVCEQEFSIADKNHGGSNHLDVVNVSRQIIQAKQTGAFVLVIIHGGHEYYQLPSPRMQNTYRFFVEIGADTVINHHQHCYSGYEMYMGKPIYYGLGNLLFDSARNARKEPWNYGYGVMIDTEDLTNCKIIPYIQSDETPGIRVLSDAEKTMFEKAITELNQIISDPISLAKQFNDYCQKKGSLSFLNPFFNGITSRFYGHRWFPSFVTRKQRFYQLHFIQCESHRDVVLCTLNKLLRNE